MDAEPFLYATIRLVPRVEREEFLNVGVLLFCRTRHYLALGVELEVARVAALAPQLDLDPVRAALARMAAVADGDPAAGPLAALAASERFGWLAAPSSTVVQASGTHGGVCTDPAAALERLMDQLVRPPRSRGRAGRSN